MLICKSNNRQELIVLVQRIRKPYWWCYSIMSEKPTLRMSWISMDSSTLEANLVVPSKKREIKTLKESQTFRTSEILKLPRQLSTFYRLISTLPCFRWPARVLQFGEIWLITAWQTFLPSKRKWTISSRQRVRVCPTPQRVSANGEAVLATTSYRLSRQRKNDFKLREDDTALTNLQTEVRREVVVVLICSPVAVWPLSGTAPTKQFRRWWREGTTISSLPNSD